MKYLGPSLFAVLLVAGTATVFAQNAANTKFNLQGRVVNSLTGQPIPRALVRLSAAQQGAVLTGPAGEFTFSGLPAGHISIFASKPGYFSPEALAPNGGFTPKSFQLGPDTGGVELKLVPEGVISGQVLGKDEEPLEGAIIEILSMRTGRGVRHLAPVSRRMPGAGVEIATNAPGTMRTDEDGNFRVAGLPPGSYYIAVKTGNLLRRPEGGRALPDSPQDSERLAYEPLVYHPGVTDFESAVPVQLSGGQHVAVDFALKKVPAYKVSGSVKGPGEWKNLHPPMIVDATDAQLFSPDSYDTDTGAFEFKALPAGAYSVRLSGSDQNQTFLMAMRKLTVDGPMSGVRFVMPPAQDIPVIVHKETAKVWKGTCTSMGADGKPRTSDCSDWAPVAVQLNSPDGRSAGSAGFGHDADAGNLTIKGVMPGRYSVRFTPHFGGYIASARCGGTDLLRDELLVPDEGSLPPMEVTLRDDMAGVKLRLKEATSARNVWAVLVPDLFGREAVVLTLTGGSDRDYSGLPPGDYQVLAFDSIEGIDANSPDLLQKYGDRATRISLSANSHTTVSLDVVKTGD